MELKTGKLIGVIVSIFMSIAWGSIFIISIPQCRLLSISAGFLCIGFLILALYSYNLLLIGGGK